jgi:hypothetical protein
MPASARTIPSTVAWRAAGASTETVNPSGRYRTVLSYHHTRLREAGLTRTRVAGRQHFIWLRAEEIEQRMPGWLAAVLGSLRAEDRAPAAVE